MNRKTVILIICAAAVLACAVVFTCVFGGKPAPAAGDIQIITAAGSYTFSGELTGRIKVDAGKNDAVELVLDGARITNPDGACVKVSSAGAVTLVLKDGTENVLISGNAENPEGSGSAVGCDTDLTVTGGGALTVYGYNNNGIHVEGNLVIERGDITVFANGDCIQATENLTVTGGNISVSSVGISDISELSALKTNTGEFGFGGGFPGTGFDRPEKAGEDGAQTEDGTSGRFGGGRPDRMTSSDGNTRFPGADRQPAENGAADSNSRDAASAESGSRKGLKAGGDLTVSGGTVNALTADDALHCGGMLEITGGTLTLASGDDGIHADDSITVSGAEIEVRYSYEGIEAHHITVNSGTVSVTASDDGFNANGGIDMFGDFGKAQKQDSETADADDTPTLIINGGTVSVNATGDGLDSNGDLIINGGTVIVDGPSTGADSALDCGAENGGVLLVNGGTLLAIGSSGMAESPESDSAQPFFFENISFSAGNVIRITDADGGELMVHTAVRGGNNIVFSVPGTAAGDILTVSVDGTETEVTVTDTSSGGSFGMPGNNRPGGFNGQMPDDFNPEDFDGRTPPGGFNGQMPDDFNPGDFDGRQTSEQPDIPADDL